MSKNGQNFSKNREIVQSLKYVYGPILKEPLHKRWVICYN